MYASKIIFVYVSLSLLLNVVIAGEEVETKYGKLRGRMWTSRKGRNFIGFQSIPYAKPPVGELRFKNPLPPDPWEGVRDATEYGPMCTQTDVFFRDETVRGQEDCLYLNVFTPKIPVNKNDYKFPVMFWVHGGGWQTGSAALYTPEYLLDHDIVLVTLNYRLGALGFLSTGDIHSPGNFGLKDQSAALQWVAKNIALFGGDPSSVTLFGQSAGGASVHYHMFSPLSQGLFHKVISQSGTSLCPWGSPWDVTPYTKKLADLLSCPVESSLELVSCLRKINVEDIVSTDKHFIEWDIDPSIVFRPVLEGDWEGAFLKERPLDVLRDADVFFKIPFMTGFTSHDGVVRTAAIYNSSLLLKQLNDDFNTAVSVSLYYKYTSPNVQEVSKKLKEFYFNDDVIDESSIGNVTDMFTTGYFALNLEETVRLHSLVSSEPVYYYLFSYRGSLSFSSKFGDAKHDYGVCHSDDLQYLFPMEEVFPGRKLSDNDNKMIDIFTKLWVNFAHTGNPIPTNEFGAEWPRVSSHDLEYLNINLQLQPDYGVFNQQTKFWRTLPINNDFTYTPELIKDEL